MSGSGWHTPIPADLDLDGKKEIVMQHQVFSSAGAVLWSLQFSGSSIFGAVLNMDADDTAEAMMNNSLGLHLRQRDGTPIAQYTRPGAHDRARRAWPTSTATAWSRSACRRESTKASPRGGRPRSTCDRTVAPLAPGGCACAPAPRRS